MKLHYEYRRSGGKMGPARIVMLAILGVVVAALFGLAFGWLVKLLWNWLMPAVFGLNVITYWQAVAMVVLGRLIFGGIAHRTRSGRRGRRDHDAWGPEEWLRWREYWREEGRDAFDRWIERKATEAAGATGGG